MFLAELWVGPFVFANRYSVTQPHVLEEIMDQATKLLPQWRLPTAMEGTTQIQPF